MELLQPAHNDASAAAICDAQNPRACISLLHVDRVVLPRGSSLAKFLREGDVPKVCLVHYEVTVHLLRSRLSDINNHHELCRLDHGVMIARRCCCPSFENSADVLLAVVPLLLSSSDFQGAAPVDPEPNTILGAPVEDWPLLQQLTRIQSRFLQLTAASSIATGCHARASSEVHAEGRLPTGREKRARHTGDEVFAEEMLAPIVLHLPLLVYQHLQLL
mmetsp:Transcript_12548/g.44444  ORF Transcript_12548/g.44444 Transcript_12548/m.44444 type:complete len:218 (-) Transcript_12548:5349-6002(-)